MKRLGALLSGLLLLLFTSAARPANRDLASTSNFPQSVRVRLWFLHPPRELQLRNDAAGAQVRTCSTCKAAAITSAKVRANGSHLQVVGISSNPNELYLSGAYQLTAASSPPIHADFPMEVRANDNHLLITAIMPIEEYIAGVLAGETGNFKSDEALKAMSVAARTYAVHFGSRHAIDGFEFCDSTHCQDLRISGINPHLLSIAQATAGEVLWYDGEPAATYYYANCGGKTEDGKYILGNDEARAPYLTQHSDQYCRRNGGTEWRGEISKRELQHALADDGIRVPGSLQSVSVLQRTASGRVEYLTLSGTTSVRVEGVAFRSAIGRHIGWERLKSNLYDVSVRGDMVMFHGRGSGHGVGLCQIGAEVMGEEGKSYRQILAFYYPGTHLGVAAQGFAWQQLGNVDVALLTLRPDRDRSLLPLATRYLHSAEESTGFVYRARPRLKVYATVAEFRNATGEPGWVAASTRGRTIQMQPSDVLRERGALESTLRHELLHMLIESYAQAGTPQWLREGLVLYLSAPDEAVTVKASASDTTALERSLRAPKSEAELRAAYAEARAQVGQLVEAHGKDAVLQWLREGLPPQVVSGLPKRAADKAVE